MTVRGTALRTGLVSLLVWGVSACGSRQEGHKPVDENGGHPVAPGGGGADNGSDGQPVPADAVILRGHWEFALEAGADGTAMRSLSSPQFFASKGTSSQPIGSQVAEAVTFTVANGNFQNGTPADGVVSFGSLDVTALRDNALRVCGTGNARCTTGKIRIYTSNAAGDGLWSATEGYGLPILTGSNTIGQGAAGAVVVAEVAIAGNTRVLKLTNFTSAPALTIPVSVDFTDAAAAAYSSTLVVEYVVE